jgi:hypothetical protein
LIISERRHLSNQIEPRYGGDCTTSCYRAFRLSVVSCSYRLRPASAVALYIGPRQFCQYLLVELLVCTFRTTYPASLVDSSFNYSSSIRWPVQINTFLITLYPKWMAYFFRFRSRFSPGTHCLLLSRYVHRNSFYLLSEVTGVERRCRIGFRRSLRFAKLVGSAVSRLTFEVYATSRV